MSPHVTHRRTALLAAGAALAVTAAPASWRTPPLDARAVAASVAPVSPGAPRLAPTDARVPAAPIAPPTRAVAARGASPVAFVDTARSVVRWRGTKFGGRGAHAGTFRLLGGRLVLDGTTLDAARLVVDARSMAVTDIPLAEAVPRTRLLRRLAGPEFLDVARHPQAVFVLRRATSLGGNVHRVEGTLTLRGVEHAVTTELTVWSYEPTALRATGRLAFDRRRWGMDFSGSPLTDDLVDDTVHLEFDIVARQEGR